MTYYVDPEHGCDGNTGLSEAAPIRHITGRAFQPGDAVLFKRGTVIREYLDLCPGSEEGYITYGAYGEGCNPAVNPSIDAGRPASWQEVEKGIWRFADPLPSEAANIIFNKGEAFGNLRWSREELKEPGEWTYTGLGESVASGRWGEEDFGGGELFLVCRENPADAYDSVEIAVFGKGRAITASHHVILENLTVENSGVHGFQAVKAHHIVIRNCIFRCIGGGVVRTSDRIRFGNAVEFWNGAQDCVVENNVMLRIYDSGVTHQGSPRESELPQRLYFRGNRFIECGLSAYEWRGPCSKDVYFENNVCMKAGGTFTMQGEPPPRAAEIPEEPSSCVHVLIWKLDKELPAADTYCYIRGNVFMDAPVYGAAITSAIDGKYGRQFVIEDNLYYQADGAVLIRMNGVSYKREDFAAYQRKTGHDRNSRLYP